jgi:TolA-binding protein
MDFLREELHRADPHQGRGMVRLSRPSARKIAGLAAVLLVVAGGIVLSITGVPGRSDETVRLAEKPSAPSVERIPARVALVEGRVVLHRDGRQVMLSETDEVLEGDSLESEAGSAVGIAWPDGTALVIDGEGRLSVRRADRDEVRVGLVYGTLAARVPPGVRVDAPLRVTGSNATLTVRGTVFSVRAKGGRLTTAAVSAGTVEVRDTSTERTFRVPGAKRLDIISWSMDDGTPDTSCMSRLARITDGVKVPTPTAPSGEVEDTEGRALTPAERIRKALQDGDLDLALQLAGQHRGSKSLSTSLAVAEAYRQAGHWGDAVEAYLAAAGSGSGKRAEKAMLRAADITLRKLREPGTAASIIDDYLKRFPQGAHLDEGLYLGGVASMKSGGYKKARSQFESYLARFPKGAQVVQVHLTLAKIYAIKMADCTDAKKHIKAVKTKAAGSPMAAEAEKIEARCKKGGTP